MAKDSTLKALNSYLTRTTLTKKRTRKNQAPEKAVVIEILSWGKHQGMSLDRVQSSAVYSAKIGRYLNSQATVGMPDIIGCDRYGHALYIEVKAPGRKSTLRESQKIFLIDKINHNAFGVCVDSVSDLERVYKAWIELRSSKMLMSLLPQ